MGRPVIMPCFERRATLQSSLPHRAWHEAIVQRVAVSRHSHVLHFSANCGPSTCNNARARDRLRAHNKPQARKGMHACSSRNTLNDYEDPRADIIASTYNTSVWYVWAGQLYWERVVGKMGSQSGGGAPDFLSEIGLRAHRVGRISLQSALLDDAEPKCGNKGCRRRRASSKSEPGSGRSLGGPSFALRARFAEPPARPSTERPRRWSPDVPGISPAVRVRMPNPFACLVVSVRRRSHAAPAPLKRRSPVARRLEENEANRDDRESGAT